jgi:hypothetical protein
MNVTRPPAAIVTSSGFIPADVIVIVTVDGGGAGEGDGGGAGAVAGTGAGDTDDGDGADEPHAAMITAAQAVTRREITFRAQ